MKAWLLIAALTLAAGGGYRAGVAAAETRAALALASAQRATIRAAEAASRAEAARLAAAAERDRLALFLEDAAHADPDASLPALGVDGVRRLNRR